MSSPSRGIPITRARALAADPSTSPSILAQLANSYPETWELLLDNPGTYPDLREWLEIAIATQASEQRTKAQVEAVHLNETVEVAPIPLYTELNSQVSAVHEPAILRVESNSENRQELTSHNPQKTFTPPQRKKKNSFLRKAISIVVPPAVIIVFCAAMVVAVAQSVAPVGTISVEDMRTLPTQNAWSESFAQGENADCVTFSAKTFAQDLAIILTQNNETDEDCRDLEDPPPAKLSLLNTKTGELTWKVDLADQLPWTKDWKKEIVEAPGLNEILVRFIDVNSAEVDKDKTLIAYNRLTGKVTDPVLAGQKDKPQQAAPVLEVTMIPGNTKDILVFTNAPEDDPHKFQLMRFDAKKLSKATWKYKTDVKPIGGNPIVGDRIVLGRESDSDTSVLAEAVSLEKGKPTQWGGRPGGKIVNVAGSYVWIQGDGVDDEIDNETSQAGTADSDGTGTPITLTGITSTGETIWESAISGYALTRSGDSINPVTKSVYGSLFSLNEDRTAAIRISPETGNNMWPEPASLGNFFLSKLSGPAQLFVYETTAESEFPDKLQERMQSNGSEISSISLPNDNTRVDGVSALTGYLVDDPQRSEAQKKNDDGQTESDVSSEDDSDDPEEMKKMRTCFTAFDLLTFTQLFSYQCNGYEHAVLLGGNWVIVDRTSEKQLVRSFALDQ